MKKTILVMALMMGMSSLANASGSSVVLYGSVDIGLETANWRNDWPFAVPQVPNLQVYQYPDVDSSNKQVINYENVKTYLGLSGIRVPISVVNPSIGNIFGVKGRLETQYGVAGFFKIETNPPAITSDLVPFWNQAYVGLETPYGSVSFGAQATATKSSVYDPIGGFNVRGADTIGQSAGYFEPSVKYVSPSMNGLTLSVSYAWTDLRAFYPSHDERYWGIDPASDTFWHLSFGAKFDDGGPFKVGLTYDQKHFIRSTLPDKPNDSYAFTIGVGYDFGHVLAFARYGGGYHGFGNTIDETLYNLGTYVIKLADVTTGPDGFADKATKAGVLPDIALIDEDRQVHHGGAFGFTFHIAEGHDLSFVDQFGVLTQTMMDNEFFPVARPYDQKKINDIMLDWFKSDGYATWAAQHQDLVKKALGISDNASPETVVAQMEKVAKDPTQFVRTIAPKIYNDLLAPTAWRLKSGGNLTVLTNIVKVVYQWHMDANTTLYAYGNYGVSKAYVKKQAIDYPVMKQHIAQAGLGFSYRF